MRDSRLVPSWPDQILLDVLLTHLGHDVWPELQICPSLGNMGFCSMWEDQQQKQEFKALPACCSQLRVGVVHNGGLSLAQGLSFREGGSALHGSVEPQHCHLVMHVAPCAAAAAAAATNGLIMCLLLGTYSYYCCYCCG